MESAPSLVRLPQAPSLGSVVQTTPQPSTSNQSHHQQSDPTASESQQDLWSSILNSVKSSKAVTTKNIVILGEPKAGKTTLLSALASRSTRGLISGNSSFSRRAINGNDEEQRKAKADTNTSDLGLSYSYFDVGDEKDRDELVARVGVYTLHSSQPAYASLLPFAFPEHTAVTTEEQASASMLSLASAYTVQSKSASTDPIAARTQPKASVETLKDSLILIVLDWEQPWTFLEQLRSWLGILHDLVDVASDGALTAKGPDQKWSKSRVALDEMREKLEAYIRSYTEPLEGSSSDEEAAAGNSNQAPGGIQDGILPSRLASISVQLEGEEAAPLTDGMLTDNWGVPIVIVCTKADAIARLERDKNFKEEQFDYIQQVLRTICMKYGAGLFYTSSLRAQSIDILRSYILHRLFTRSAITLASSTGQAETANHKAVAPISSAAGTSGSASGNSGAAGGTAAFPFTLRASTTDRDTLLVPAGWDSWGKIKALREPFDCNGIGRGWTLDCELESIRRARGLARTSEVDDQLEKEVLMDLRATAGSGDDPQSAIKLYEDIVSDWEADSTGKDATNKVKIPDEASFLSIHQATLQKDPDPRSKFSKRGVVGPVSGSTSGLPSVEKLMAKNGSSAADEVVSVTPSSRAPRTDSTPVSASKREYTAAAAAGGASGSERSSRPASPAVSPGATSPGGAPKQSEVLHSFFQSLLKDKGSSVGSPKVSDRLHRSASSAKRDT